MTHVRVETDDADVGILSSLL